MPTAPGGPVAPIELGDFVLCNFPYIEAPDEPGPTEHFGLCLGTMASAGGRFAVVAAYTTSQSWPDHARLPAGVHRVSPERARQLGHTKSFVVDARKIAFMPLTKDFFPHLDENDSGRVGRDRALANRVLSELKTISQTPGVVVRLGPLRPR